MTRKEEILLLYVWTRNTKIEMNKGYIQKFFSSLQGRSTRVLKESHTETLYNRPLLPHL